MPRTPFTAGSVTVLVVPHDPTAAPAVAAKLADYVPNRRSALLRWSLVRVNEPGPNLYGRCERLDGCQTTRVPPTIERVEPVLNVRDVAASTKFYARLGFVEQFRDDPESPMFVIVIRDDAVVVLQWHDFVGIAGDRPTLRFPVADVDGLSDEFGDLPDRTAVSNTAWGTREFHVRDADGNGLQFYRDL